MGYMSSGSNTGSRVRNANVRSSNPKPPPLHHPHHPPFAKRQTDTSSPPTHTGSPDPAHHPGLSKNQTGIGIKTNMVTTNILRPDQPRDCDRHLGQSYPLPPRSSSYTPPIPHLGPSYTVTSNQLHKTAGTPNDESRQNPGLFQMKSLFSFFYSFPMDSYLIIQIPIHYYTHYHTLPVTFTTTLFTYSPPLSFTLSCFMSCCVRAHKETH